MCNIDVAMGYAAIDLLHQRGYEKIVNPVHFGQTAMEPEIYGNKRVEMWCAVKDWMAQDGVNIPDDDELHMDLACVPDVKETVDGPMRLESKKTIRSEFGKSPDIGDALALTFAFPIAMKHTVEKIKRTTKGQTKQEMWGKRGSFSTI